MYELGRVLLENTLIKDVRRHNRNNFETRFTWSLLGTRGVWAVGLIREYLESQFHHNELLHLDHVRPSDSATTLT